MDMELYGEKVVVEPEDGDTSKVNIRNVDLTLFFGQFIVADILDNLEYDEVMQWVHATNGENEL